MPVARVMVVGGHSAVADVIRIHLHTQRPEIHVEFSLSPASALDCITRGFSGVVVADVGMAPISGMALLREARRPRPNLPIVIMMGPFRYGLAIEALNAGAYAILSKPLKREECIAVLEAAFRANRLARTVDADRIRLHRCMRRVHALEPDPGWRFGSAKAAGSNAIPDAIACTVARLGRAQTRLKHSHEDLLAAQGEARLRGWLRAGEHPEDLVPLSCYVR
jgi:FixJ family two-component response regulator